MKKITLFLYILYFVSITELLFTPLDLSNKVETTQNTIIIQSTIEHIRIIIFLVLIAIGILSIINTIRNYK